jgi:DnaJ-class molecular chaperone
MGRHSFRAFGSTAAAVAGGAIRDDASCFADEVVVDFPSVAPAVDRIRSAFLADERGATLSAAIHLSPREAIAGVTVPLDVPVRCTCRSCGGRGETWPERCTRCAGSGTELLDHQVQVSVPAGVTDGARFHFTVTPRHNPPTRIELRVLVT